MQPIALRVRRDMRCLRDIIHRHLHNVLFVILLHSSPVATAWLVTEAAGTALSAAAVRVSAATLAALSLPDDEQAWDIAAEAARNGDVAACGRAMLQAHAVDDDALFAWWWDRMPTR